MITDRRVFDKALHSFISRTRLWPKAKSLRDSGVGFKTEYYHRLTIGHPASERLVLGVLRYFGQVTGPDGDAVVEFIGKTYAIDIRRASDDEVLSKLTAVSDVVGTASRQTDHLQYGFRWIVNLFTPWLARQLMTKVQAVRRPQEIREAVSWIYVSLGRFIKEQPDLPRLSAIRTACSLMPLTVDEYAARAVAWWEFDPWTVVLLRNNDRPRGVNIVLPLLPAAYANIVSGVRPTYRCTPPDFVTPSSHLVIEACSERPHRDTCGPTRTTRGLAFLQLAQVAALSRSARLDADEPLELLSFAAFKLGQQRLTSYGFRPTGTLMAETRVPLFARKVALGGIDSNLVIRGFFDSLGRIMPDAPPP